MFRTYLTLNDFMLGESASRATKTELSRVIRCVDLL